MLERARETAARKRADGTRHFNLWHIFLFHSTQCRWIFPLIINWKWSYVSGDFCRLTIPRNGLHKKTEGYYKAPVRRFVCVQNVWQRFLNDTLYSILLRLSSIGVLLWDVPHIAQSICKPQRPATAAGGGWLWFNEKRNVSPDHRNHVQSDSDDILLYSDSYWL